MATSWAFSAVTDKAHWSAAMRWHLGSDTTTTMATGNTALLSHIWARPAVTSTMTRTSGERADQIRL